MTNRFHDFLKEKFGREFLHSEMSEIILEALAAHREIEARERERLQAATGQFNHNQNLDDEE